MLFVRKNESLKFRENLKCDIQTCKRSKYNANTGGDSLFLSLECFKEFKYLHKYMLFMQTSQKLKIVIQFEFIKTQNSHVILLIVLLGFFE